MKYKHGQYIRLVSVRLAPLLGFLLLWEGCVSRSDKLQFLFASPSKVAWKLFTDIYSSNLLEHIAITTLETVSGFILGCLLGSGIGLALGVTDQTAKAARLYIVALSSVPIFAIAPMTVIWFGTGLSAKIYMAGLSTVFVAAMQAYEGTRNVDEDLIILLRSFGANRWQVLSKLLLPSALIWVLAAYKLNIGFALLGAFIGEFISADRGLGHYILKGSALYDVPQVLAGVTCLALIALLMSSAVGLAERLLLPWKRRHQES